MKKNIKYDKNATEELKEFNLFVQRDLIAIIDILKNKGRLEYPEGKKLTKNIFEIRLKRNGAFRGFYAYIIENSVIILHFFRKKSQKTPNKNLKLAEKRLKKYV